MSGKNVDFLQFVKRFASVLATIGRTRERHLVTVESRTAIIHRMRRFISCEQIKKTVQILTLPHESDKNRIKGNRNNNLEEKVFLNFLETAALETSEKTAEKFPTRASPPIFSLTWIFSKDDDRHRRGASSKTNPCRDETICGYSSYASYPCPWTATTCCCCCSCFWTTRMTTCADPYPCYCSLTG